MRDEAQRRIGKDSIKALIHLGICVLLGSGAGYVAVEGSVVGLIIAAGALLALMLYAILKSPVLGIYLLALSVPLVEISVHIGVSLYLSRLALLITLGSILLRGSTIGTFRLPRTALHFLLLMLIAVLSASLLVAEDQSFGARILFIYLELVLTFYTLVLVLKRPRQVEIVVTIMIITGTLLALYGGFQVGGHLLGIDTRIPFLENLPAVHWKHRLPVGLGRDFGFPRARGTLGESNIFAGYLLSLLPLSGCMAFLTKERARSRVYRLLPLFFLLLAGAFVLTFSRSGLVGLIGSILAILAVYPRVLSERKVWFVCIALIVGLVLANIAMSAIFSRPLIDLVVDRLSRILNPQDVNIAAHRMTLEIALEAFSRRPLLGFGLGNLGNFYSPTFQVSVPGAHSDFLQFLAETGIIGFSTQVAVMAAALLYLWSALRKVEPGTRWHATLLGFFSGYMGMLFGNIFYSYYASEFLWFFMAVGVAVAWLVHNGVIGGSVGRNEKTCQPSHSELER